MNKFLLLGSLSFLFLSFIPVDDCPKGIIYLPMYGKVKKCKEQLQSDTLFIKAAVNRFGDKTEASRYYVSRGWAAFNKKNNDSAMLKFNQAWLLDSVNAEVYWGFGNLIGIQKKYKESLKYFRRSIDLNDNNAKVWEAASSSNLQVYFKTKDNTYLNAGIRSLKMAAKLDPRNAKNLASLAAAYCYFDQKDSAAKYLKLADKLDKSVVDPNVRRVVSSQTRN